MSGWIELAGAVNVRDLGGLPLADGGETRPGVLLRADNLQGLTADDLAELEARGVARVVDLRTGGEVRLEGPGPLVGRLDIRHRSLHPEAGQATDMALGDVMPWRRPALEGETPAVSAYMGYLRDRPDSIVAALDDVASADGAVVVHCAAGKDRTGVVCALALAVAGVRREAIVADYVATGERVAAIMRRLRASSTYEPDLRGSPDERHLPLPETMERVLELLDERHGGPLGWLAGQGFEPAPLRARLT